MAASSRAVSVGTTATRLDTVSDNPGQGQSLYNAGAVTVWLGGPAVTTATGYPLAAGEHCSIDLAPSDALYGIVASGTAEVRVFEVGV